MLERVAVDLGSRCLQNARAHALGQTEHVQRAHYISLHRLHRIVLIVNRRSRTGQVINLIDLEQDGFDDIMAQQLELMIAEQVQNVFAPPGEEIVETDDFLSFGDQAIAQVRTNESGTASD